MRSPKADVTSTTAQTIIHRLSGSRISAAISVLVLAVAVFTLYRLVRDVDLAKVVAALEAQPIKQIAVAAAFVVAGYFTLTFYDLFALRMIGRHAVPYPVAALASFTSSTIGHSLGAAVLTGGLVRLRIYAAWGLTVIDVGKIAVITGMTFWLGNAFLLGGAVTYAPETASAIDHMPSSVNRAIGLAALSAIVCYLTWLAGRPRAIGRSPWRIVLPNMRFTLVQIGIGATDLCLVTLAMYTLLPSNPECRLSASVRHFPDRSAARHRQPRARRPRRHRGDDAHRPAAISSGGVSGGAADVPRALFPASALSRRALARAARAAHAGGRGRDAWRPPRSGRVSEMPARTRGGRNPQKRPAAKAITHCLARLRSAPKLVRQIRPR